MITAIHAFRDAIREAGIEPPDKIEADGRLHRFGSNGKRADDAGWYVLHDDGGIPAGAFGCWRNGVSENWRGEIGRKLTSAEAAQQRARLEVIRREREADEARMHAEARKKAAEIWEAAQPVADHPYLLAKGIYAHGVKLHEGALVIPMRDTVGMLHSLECIGPNGEKRFLTGGRVKGCYYSIGKPNGTICIAEGYATAASVHEATGHAVAVAFNAGNLEVVALAIKRKMPDAEIIIAADDDALTVCARHKAEGNRRSTLPSPDSCGCNPGLTKAHRAASAVGGKVAAPKFTEAEQEAGNTDFNDLAKLRPEAVRDCVQTGVLQVPPPARSSENQRVMVRLTRGSDLTPEAIRWLWNGWLALGKLHVLAGVPGTGKTTIALAVAAAVTCGRRLPDGSRCDPGNVLIWSGEDDPRDTLLPRLLAMGANSERVYFVDGAYVDGEPVPFDPARHMNDLTDRAREIGDVRLLIVDPVVNAVAGDSHKAAEVRRALQPVVDLASALSAAAIGISHFAKGTAGRDPLERVNGSGAFGALPRIVMATAKIRGDDDDGPGAQPSRILVRTKSNIGPDGSGYEYDLGQIELPGYPGIYASRVLWGEPVEGTAKQLLAVAETEEDQATKGETTDAVTVLKTVLEKGPVKASDAMREARAVGLSDKSIRTAREKLGVKPIKSGFEEGWMWKLPDAQDAREDAQDAHHGNGAPSAPSAASSGESGSDEVVL